MRRLYCIKIRRKGVRWAIAKDMDNRPLLWSNRRAANEALNHDMFKRDGVIAARVEEYPI